MIDGRDYRVEYEDEDQVCLIKVFTAKSEDGAMKQLRKICPSAEVHKVTVIK